MQFHVKNQHRRQDSLANFKEIFLLQLVQLTCILLPAAGSRLPAACFEFRAVVSSWFFLSLQQKQQRQQQQHRNGGSRSSRQKCQSRGRKKTNFCLLPACPHPFPPLLFYVSLLHFAPLHRSIPNRSQRRLLPPLSVKQRTQTETPLANTGKKCMRNMKYND